MKKNTLLIFTFLIAWMFSTGQNSGRGEFAVSASEHSGKYAVVSDRSGLTADCDTLRYPLQGQIIYYFIEAPNFGYTTGNNSYLDKAKAEYFSDFQPGTTINGMIADFVVAKNASNVDITFAIWANDGANGKPGTLVASTTKSLSSIAADVNNELASSVVFNLPYTVTGPFYAGILLPSAAGDTVALWCRKHVAGYVGTAWEQWKDNTWHAFNEPASWGTDMQTSMTIHPIVCQPLGINDPEISSTFATPTPSTGIVNIEAWKTAGKIFLEVYSPTGEKVYSRAFPGSVSNFNIDLSSLGKGMYIVRMSDGKKTTNQKLLLN